MEENETNVVSLDAIRADLVTEIREAWHEEETQRKADESLLECHLVEIELGTVFIAVIAIVIMQRMHLEGLCEVGTLVPSGLLAIFRIVKH